jgi:phage-related protein
MSTFTYIPSYGAALKKKPAVLSIKFGDGYEQRAQFGINQNPRIWNLSFNGRTETEATAIDAFLTAEAGTDWFNWTPPLGAAGKWICRDWDVSIVEIDCYNISASFEEVFDLG